MLHARLLSIMRQEVTFRRLNLSSYGKKRIEGMILQGMQRMKTMGADNHPSHTMKAEKNLKGLIVYLADYSKKTGTFPHLSETDFDAAMRESPAFWPFCSAG